MAQVQLEIGGNPYVLACRDGEEEHLRKVAALVDEKAQESARSLGRSSEARTLLFAALLLADELQESRAKLIQATSDLETLHAEAEHIIQTTRTESARDLENTRLRLAKAEAAVKEIASRPPPPPDQAPARAIESLADRVEALAARLEKAGATA